MASFVPQNESPFEPARVAANLVDLAGRRRWNSRIAALKQDCTPGYSGRALAQRHALEFAVDALCRPGRNAPLTATEREISALANAVCGLEARLSATGRSQLAACLDTALTGDGTLIDLFHLVRTASLHHERGFSVAFAGLEEGAPFDLLLRRDGAEAEIACDVISAESGRDVHRGAWFALMDRVDPDLQSWLAAHPGRYLLKMTLPKGLRGCDGSCGGSCGSRRLVSLHARITALLKERRRADHDEAAVLRLDPLLLAAAKAPELGLMSSLRKEFGPEAHLAVTAAGGGVFVMAARAGREDEVAAAVHRRMAEIAPTRLTGTRPGILAMFLEDTDRIEWRLLRDQLRLEGEARHFLTRPEAKNVVAVTCASRLELVGGDAGGEGCELRFRNPNHPFAKTPALASAVLSSG